VVGVGASGIQIAKELATFVQNHQSDPVRMMRIAILVGRHCRWPRTYRGKDILWWMDWMGAFHAPANPDNEASTPSPQLTGSLDHVNVNLYRL